MPVYLYKVEEERLEVQHPMADDPRTWGELCQVAGLEVGQRAPEVAVERLIVPVAGRVSNFSGDLKNSGFRRLERRDKGVYEDVTASNKGERFIDAN